MTATIR